MLANDYDSETLGSGEWMAGQLLQIKRLLYLYGRGNWIQLKGHKFFWQNFESVIDFQRGDNDQRRCHKSIMC